MLTLVVVVLMVCNSLVSLAVKEVLKGSLNSNAYLQIVKFNAMLINYFLVSWSNFNHFQVSLSVYWSVSLLSSNHINFFTKSFQILCFISLAWTTIRVDWLDQGLDGSWVTPLTKDNTFNFPLVVWGQFGSG